MSYLKYQLCELIALGLVLSVAWGCSDHRTTDVSTLPFTARQSATQTATNSESTKYPLSEKGAIRLTPTSTSFHPEAPSVTLGRVSFIVELAITSAERTKGLSGRNHLPPKSGMLFISDSGPIGPFWMKEMKFPLDLIWISEACFIVHITPDIPTPVPDTPDSKLGYYFSKEPAVFTLEVNGGEAADNDISVGTRVYFTNIPGDRATRCWQE